MTRYFLICVFLFGSFSGKADSPMNHADSLYNASSYSCAALEYEWVNFTATDNTTRAVALLKKSYCYKKLGNFLTALSTVKRIQYDDLDDSLLFRLRYEHALLAYLCGNYNEADIYLSEIGFYYNDSIANSILYLDILNQYEMQQWHDADSLFQKYIMLNSEFIDSSGLQQIAHRPELLNPKTAKIISLIIPGSGQIYGGKIIRGLTSIIFQGAFALYTYINIREGFYLTAFTSSFGEWFMFYTGGARYAEFLTEKENASRINQYNKSVKSFILQTENRKIKQ